MEIVKPMTLIEADKTETTGAAAFVQSELFARTFREGMALVEETANYLDGDGREASKGLGRDAALSYASASMRLTTQLMQIASWLLVLRAVREGEMALSEAGDAKYRVEHKDETGASLQAEGMPDRLIGLVEEAHQLFSRISRLDADLFSTNAATSNASDAAGQQRALHQAFGNRS